MHQTQNLSLDLHLQEKLTSFVNEYGLSGLDNALDLYTKMHCKYVCRTKTSVSIIHIYDINYITVSGHQLTIHTECGTFSKYGTLTKELKLLSSYGFIRCSQNYIVALSKIKSITENTIIMMDHSKIHISRNYTSKVIMAFTMQSKK